MDKVSLEATHAKVPPHNFKLRARGATDNDVGAMARVLGPVRAKPVADAEQRFSRMLGEFEQARDPPAVLAVTLILDILKPLQRIRLGLLLGAPPRRHGLQRLEGVELLGELAWNVRTAQRSGRRATRAGEPQDVLDHFRRAVPPFIRLVTMRLGHALLSAAPSARPRRTN